jgi:hypothetical protein
MLQAIPQPSYVTPAAALTSVNGQGVVTEVVMPPTSGITTQGNFQAGDKLCWNTQPSGVGGECVGGTIVVTSVCQVDSRSGKTLRQQLLVRSPG